MSTVSGLRRASAVAVAVLVPVRISHCDCAGVNCTQKKAWRPLDGDLESSDFMIKEGPGAGAQAVYLELFAQKTGHSRGSCLFCFCVRWGEYKLD